MKLSELVAPEHTVVLTQECQKGVIGDLSLLPALAESAQATGMIANVGRIVARAGPPGAGSCTASPPPAPIVGVRASTRPLPGDREGAGRRSCPMTRGGTELVDGIEAADSDLFSTRIGGLSPVNGTDAPRCCATSARRRS